MASEVVTSNLQILRLGKAKVLSVFMSGFAKTPTSDRSSGEQRAGWFISNALFAEVAKKRF